MDIAETINEDQLTENQRKSWLKALSAIELRNFDYAITLLQAILKEQPGFLKGRRFLRQAAVNMKKGQKKGLLDGISTGGGYDRLVKKDPATALVEIEKALAKKPYGKSENRALHDAAVRMNMVDLAVFALETIKEGHPDDTSNLHRLAEYHLAQDEPGKALEIYQQISRVDPQDQDAVKGSRDAAARASMKSGGWMDEDKDFREKTKNPNQAKELEVRNRAGQTKEMMAQQLDLLFERYNEDNSNLDTVRQIASLYENLEEWASALQYYEWALHLSPGDQSIEDACFKTRAKASQAVITEMERELAVTPNAPDTDEKRARIEAARQEHQDTMLAEARSRVERNPTDKQLRFDYGELLYSAGRYKEAIPELQQATSNPHLGVQATIMLGRCYHRREMLDMAERQFQKAASQLVSMDGTKKALLYDLGLVYEQLGRKEEALEIMKQIMEADYNYRDVAERVEASYST
jgi:tetratricopeptide (TPR) repeat protein